ncbi:MAG: hypothetical protein R3A79_01995 [Nannocystaceae bacterium]
MDYRALPSFVALALGASCILESPDFDDTATSASTSTQSASLTDTTDATDATDATSTTSTTSATEATTSTTASASATTDASATETGSSTGDATADPSASDSDATSGGPACGDGALDEGEACDDGNTDDGDGCSALCHVPPTGVGFGDDAFTPQIGSGLYDDTATCSQVIRGWAGRLDNNEWICRPRLGCATVVVNDDLSVSTPMADPTPAIGLACFEPSMAWTRPCDDGMALVGARGRIGSLVDQLRPRCAPIVISEGPDGFAVATGEVVELPAVGGDGGDPFGPVDCPQDFVAVAVKIHAGSWLESFSIECKRLTLTYD